MELILGKGGKPFDQFINAAEGFWLPADTPFGNFQSKLFKIFERLGHANRRLEESAANWSVFVALDQPGGNNPGAAHKYATEEAVFMIRRAADELVSLVWILHERLARGTYPERVNVDSVGGAINFDNSLFKQHLATLTLLNNVANAQKHSFVDSDLHILGRDEPCVTALGLKSNSLNNVPVLYVVSLDGLTRDFNAFLLGSLGYVRTASEQLRD
ncbi:hypothetical protein [Cryobacterium sp. Hb1]|uniref:hypothetical protein n=1 Tax=Cryobacterium sp. Hb1 TaxID=1259147 RepID=UPI0010699580|nr:hypothetical protein [Cryobacterium sp. Hb1]TFD63729.1 hypothetical protein E3T38_16245 [Cryobacterium sp. Hb1]